MPVERIQLDQATVAFEERPAGAERAPGVLVIHEVTGLNDYVQEVVHNVADRGFLALAVDLYEGKTANGMQDGAPLREKVTENVFRTKMGGGVRHLKSHPSCNGHLGVMGFCMGGGFALWAACLFPDDIEACSMFYGRIGDLSMLQNLRHPVIGNFGAEDTGITTWVGQEFWPEIAKLNKTTLEPKVYPGAPHGFARHTDSKTYRPEAAKDAFERTFRLFDSTLRV